MQMQIKPNANRQSVLIPLVSPNLYQAFMALDLRRAQLPKQLRVEEVSLPTRQDLKHLTGWRLSGCLQSS